MATGQTLAIFTAFDGEPPSANSATLDVHGNVPVWDFPDAADRSLDFGGVMPRNYGGSAGVTVTVGWMTTATVAAETISLDVSFMSVSDDVDDTDSKAFATAKNANPTCANVVGEIDYVTIVFTHAEMDSIAPGEYFRMRITRDGDATTSTDDLTDDMELVFVEIRET